MYRKLTKRFVLWIALPAGALGAIFYFQVGLVAVCLYALIGLLTLGALMTQVWIKPLKVERELSREVVRIGEPVVSTIKIHNRAPWPILWLYAEDTLPRDMPKKGVWRRLLFIPPRRSFYMSYQLTVTRRGCHPLGPLVMETGDVFGLFKRCRIDRRRAWVTAVPDYEVIEDFQVGQRRRLGELGARRSIFEDPTRVQGVREYRRGDPMKIIHWKSTARTGRLCSKVFEPVVEPGATVVLDFHRETWRDLFVPRQAELPAEEIAVQAACATCRYLADGGWKVGLFSNGRDPLGLPGMTVSQARAADTLSDTLIAAHGRLRDDRLEPIAIRAAAGPEQFPLIHENLGRVALTNGLPIEDHLVGELPYIERNQAIIMITGRVRDTLIETLLTVRELGYRVLLFVVCDNEGHDRAFDRLVPHGVELHRMDEAWRLKEIATGRHAI